MIGGTIFAVLAWQEVGPFSKDVAVEEADGEKPVIDEPPRFIDMDPLVIPIFQGDRVAATIQIQLKLEALGADNEERIIKLMPRLSDAFVSDLYSFIPRLLKKEERLDVSILKQRIQMAADKITGQGVVKEVLIQSVIDRPGR